MTTILVLTNQQLTYLKDLSYEIINQSDITVTLKVYFDRPTDLFYAGLALGIEMAYKEAGSVNVHIPSVFYKDTADSQGTKTEAHQGREGNQQERN